MKHLVFHFDSERCTKCFACEVACKQWYGIKAGTIKLRRVIEVTGGTFPDVTRKFLSISCMHCGKAPCITACPTGAITKREADGIVVVDRAKCIGCHACLEACPFGSPQFDADGVMHLCDMCLELVQQGKKPVCVESCPTKALRWGTANEIADLITHKQAGKSVGR